MIISSVASLAHNENQTVIYAKLEENDCIKKGDFVDIPLCDGTIVSKEIIELKSQSNQICYSTNNTYGSFIIEGIAAHMIADQQFLAWKAFVEEHQKDICLTPYMELCSGNLSIYDYVEKGYTVPDKVLLYLQTTNPYMMSPGIYEHPFKKGQNLLGPYWYTDGTYYWDRDTWKYVAKYGLKLPNDFIDMVLSEKGTAFLNSFYQSPNSWTSNINKMKQDNTMLCLLPDNAGDISLDDF